MLGFVSLPTLRVFEVRSPPCPIPTDTTTEFANGLILVAETMPHVQSAAFNLLIPAGAAYEPQPGAFGSATMLAEWITRGAGDRDSRALLGALDNLGVSHGEGAQSLHTSISAATLGRNLIPALDLFADVVLRPRLDDDEVEPIRALAIQNLQGIEDDPGSKVILELRRRHFPDPWGRPRSGTLADVEGITPDALRAFHQARYQPDGTILAVAGAIDWNQLRDAVGRLFDDWQARPTGELTASGGGPAREHLVKETQQTQIALAFPTVPVTDPDYYQARAMVGVLGGYSSARLFTEVREKRGLCYTVYASYESQKDRAAVVCYAGTSTDRAQETLDVTLAEIQPPGPRRVGGRGAGHHARRAEKLAHHGSGRVEHESRGEPGVGLVLPGSRPLARRDRREPRRPDDRVGRRLRPPARPASHDDRDPRADPAQPAPGV